MNFISKAKQYNMPIGFYVSKIVDGTGADKSELEIGNIITKIEDKEKAEKILKNCMENAAKLTVPLEVELSEANNWYYCK